MNILVLCTGNSARSILLEALFNMASDPRITAFSAGSQPSGKVHPQSLALLAALAHETSQYRSKSWDEFSTADAPAMDIVITVCGSAAAETCPIWPGTPLHSHWGVDDPATAKTNDQLYAFQQTYEILNRRTKAFLNLPLQELPRDDLRRELQRIGQIT